MVCVRYRISGSGLLHRPAGIVAGPAFGVQDSRAGSVKSSLTITRRLCAPQRRSILRGRAAAAFDPRLASSGMSAAIDDPDTRPVRRRRYTVQPLRCAVRRARRRLDSCRDHTGLGHGVHRWHRRKRCAADFAEGAQRDSGRCAMGRRVVHAVAGRTAARWRRGGRPLRTAARVLHRRRHILGCLGVVRPRPQR